jgi:hypothetical protein
MDLSPPRLAPAGELIAQALARRRILAGLAMTSIALIGLGSHFS